MDRLKRLSLMKLWSSWSGFRRSCLRDPEKFVTLSDIKTRGWKRLEINRLIAVMHLSLEKSSAFSRWMTGVTRHVKRQMCVFTSFSLYITAKGPRYSKPKFAKTAGNELCWNLTSCRSAIGGWRLTARNLY